jgi:hypothetical protein
MIDHDPFPDPDDARDAMLDRIADPEYEGLTLSADVYTRTQREQEAADLTRRCAPVQVVAIRRGFGIKLGESCCYTNSLRAAELLADAMLEAAEVERLEAEERSKGDSNVPALAGLAAREAYADGLSSALQGVTIEPLPSGTIGDDQGAALEGAEPTCIDCNEGVPVGDSKRCRQCEGKRP